MALKGREVISAALSHSSRFSAAYGSLISSLLAFPSVSPASGSLPVSRILLMANGLGRPQGSSVARGAGSAAMCDDAFDQRKRLLGAPLRPVAREVERAGSRGQLLGECVIRGEPRDCRRD